VASVERPEEFALFYDRQAAPLLRFFVGCTLDPEVAADLTAETFAEVFEARARFRSRGPGSARAWLYGLARHQLGRYSRTRRVAGDARRRLGLPARALSTSDYDRIEELIDFEAVASVIDELVRQLPPDQRLAVGLRIVQGLPYVEVARRLNCREDAARARVSRALRRLAGQLRWIQHSELESRP
jgi:RNA polymerase sigma-70 factor (ECF subfamily)